MRLLYVSHSFPPPRRPLSNVGGMQRVASELYQALARNESLRVEPLVLRSSWRWTHVKVIPFMVRVLMRLFRTGTAGDRIDLVLFSSMVTASLAVPFRRRFRRLGVRTAAIVHGRDVTLPVPLYQWFVSRVLASLDLILPISEAVQRECAARGAHHDQIRRVPNGIDLSRYATLAPRGAARERIATMTGAPHLKSDDALVLCSVGRQVPRKGFRWFVEHVMPTLPPEVAYVLAGEGPEREAILDAARRSDVADRVFLLGRVDENDLASLYRASDLFVMPNVPVPGDMEGFGVVMLEAGANGLPTIASELEGISDVISPGINGELLEPQVAEAFSDAIQTYSDDRDRLRWLSVRAQQHVHATFSWEAVADQYVSALGSLMPVHLRPVAEPQPLVLEPEAAAA